jgi:hypothetical protein
MTNTITPEALRILLLENECIIEFTKLNGEEEQEQVTNVLLP